MATNLAQGLKLPYLTFRFFENLVQLKGKEKGTVCFHV